MWYNTGMKTIAVIAATTTAGLCAAYPLYPRSGASQCADTPPPPTQEVVAKPTPPPPAAPKKAAAPCTSPRTVAGATVTLKDGSVLKGELLSQKIVGNAIFRSDLALPVDIVKSVAFKGKGGEAKVELVNKDAFTMTIVDKSYKVKSTLGDLDVPCASIRQLSLSSRKACGDAEDGLVFHCTFDDEAAITSPAVGPKGIFQGGEFTPGKNGNALSVPAFTSGAKFDLPSGVIGTAGTIEFWGKANELGPLTDGGCPRFFEILKIGKGEISQDWNSNNGGGGYGLTFRMDGLPWMATSSFEYSSAMRSSYRRAPMRPDAEWHHYALVWDVNGVDIPGKSSAAVYLDGKLILSTPFVPTWKGPVNVADGSTLLFPCREDEMPGYSRRAFTIDDFKIWNYAKTDFPIANH